MMQAYFNGDASPQVLLESIRSGANQIWPSMDAPQQQQLQTEVDALSESLKNCLVAAGDRHDQLEKDLKSFRDYEKLLGEINQFIVSYSMMNEETATNIPALRTLIANLEARAAFFQVNPDF